MTRHLPESLTRLPPPYFVRGDNASARYKPGHGVGIGNSPLSRLRRLPPSYCVRGDNASARYKPEHGVHWHGLLRGHRGTPELPAQPVVRSGAERSDSPSPLLRPSGRAEKRRAWGGRGHRRMAALRALTRCGCLSRAPQARSEFRRAAGRTSRPAACLQDAAAGHLMSAPRDFDKPSPNGGCRAESFEKNRPPAHAQRAQTAIKLKALQQELMT